MVGEKVALVKRGEEISFQIPEALIKEFGKELRVVIRYPWIIGIPVIERLKPEIFKGKNGDLFFVPKLQG